MKTLVEWALAQTPIRVKTRVEETIEYTPARLNSGGLSFFAVNGAFLGAGEPYEVDKSEYCLLDVYEINIPRMQRLRNT